MINPDLNKNLSKKTAILIIHGVGQQNKYQTVADFAAGLKVSIEKETGGEVSAERVLCNFSGAVESILRLKLNKSDDAGIIDVVEYYYQPKLQRTVSLADVASWLISTSTRIRDIYKNLPSLNKDEKTNNKPIELGYMMYASSYLIPMIIWLARILKLLRLPEGIYKFLYTLIGWWLDPLIVDYVGDVTAYTAIDPKEKLNTVREEILSGSLSLLKDLLSEQEGEMWYDQIIIAGHSLGSVVAYDTLSALSSEFETGKWTIDPLTLKRIVGFVTFGSPLDKIALLFWPFEVNSTTSKNPVKAEWNKNKSNLYCGMLQHFHGMRGLSDRLIGDTSSVTQPSLSRPLEHVVWLNYFHPKDLIGGGLDVYKGVTNIRTYAELTDQDYLDTDQKFPEAHSFYWYDSRMHNSIVEVFITDDITKRFGDIENLKTLEEKYSKPPL